ncbi:MAG TPA: cytochrome P450 [Micromonosporaceae bacterium]
MPSPSELTPITAVTAPDPYPYYAGLVADRPFGWDAELELWVAASAAAVTEVLGATALRVRPPAEPVPAGLVGTAAGEVFGRLVRMTDGPRPQRLKQVLVTALGQADPARVAAVAAERAAQTLKRVDGSTWRELMFAVPAQVVATLGGLAERDAVEASRLIADFVACIPASATPAQQATAANAASALSDLLSPLLTEGARGLFGDLFRTAGADGWTDRPAVLANAIGLLSQTYDATAGLIGNTLVALAQGSAKVPDDPAGWPDLVREVARFDAPVQNTRRFAATSTSICGFQVAAGEPLLVVLAAANRDPAANDEPAVFRVDRPDRRLFTFGAASHRCPGETVAVAIAATVVEQACGHALVPASLPDPVAYLPLANARIPAL